MSYDKISDVKIGDVIYIEVDFSEGLQTKRRPCLAIKVAERELGRFPIYSFRESGYESQKEEVKRVLYEIKDWTMAGLSRISWVNVANYEIVNPAYLNIEIIGKFTKKDIDGLIEFYKNYLSHLN